MPFCGQCGNKVDDGILYCPNCGGPIAPAGGQAQPYYPGAAPGQAYGPAPVYKIQDPTSVGSVLKAAFALLGKKPIRLWGVSLMFSLLTFLAYSFGVLPIISIPIVLVLTAGMEMVYLAGLRGQEVKTDHLFVGFKSFWRTAGGMGWRELWLLIWSMIPFVGPIFAMIKGYSYRFVPYIVMDDKEISANDALRKSMNLTDGYKGKMFATELVIYAIISGAFLVLALLSLIPYARYLFIPILFVAMLAVAAFMPLLLGIVRAYFYEEISKLKANQPNNSITQ